jgi:hypothetical protein
MRSRPWLLCATLILSTSTQLQAGETIAARPAGTRNPFDLLRRDTLTPLRTLIGVKATATRIQNAVRPAGHVPGDLIVIRVARRLLEQQIDREIVRDDPVNDRILGTDIRGKAYVRGTSQLLMASNNQRAEIEAVFEGTIQSKTVGYNGPVVLQIDSSTPFRASKRIVMDAGGIRMSPTAVTARTTSHTTAIDAQVGGLRGRLAERVAWKRSAQLQSEADAIGSRSAALQIRKAFDEEVGEASALLEASLLAAIPKVSWEDGTPLSVRFRSAPTHVEIILYRAGATVDERALRPPAIVGDPAIAIRAYRGMLLRTVTAANLQQMLQPLMTGSILDSDDATSRPDNVAYLVNWSPDGQWFAFDHTDSPETASAINRIRSSQTVLNIPMR